MASMVVANAIDTQLSSAMMAAQEKGSRNKRKFRADPPLGDPGKIASLPETDCSSYEFTADKFEIASCHGQSSVCDLCSSVNVDHSDGLKLDLGLSSPAAVSSDAGITQLREEELEVDESQDADWSDLTESQLEELVLSNLDMIFKSAIKKIVACGYTEELATKAVFRPLLCFGSKDCVSNVVDNALLFLRSGQELDDPEEDWFEDLQQLEKYVLAELVCVLREIRPFFSTGDAMWSLLVCDMNVSHAWAMDRDPMSILLSDGMSNTNSCTAKISDCQSESPGTKLKDVTNLATENVENKPFSAGGGGASQSPSHAQEEKIGSGNCRRVSVSSTKRDYVLRQKSLHLDKAYRTYGSKGSSRSAKLSSLLMDKKLKAVSECTSIVKNAPLKTNKPNVGVSEAPVASKPDPKALPVADTELSLSLPSTAAAEAPPPNRNFSGIPYDKSSGKWVPRDKKDAMILKLAPRVRELQSQMEEWTEWANQKVMQAARRLGKEKEELRMLRQEKEDAERLKKEKHAMEENTIKKISEMENALRKAGGQVERANSTVRRLEGENVVLRREMEAAVARAAESAANCQDVARRERRMLIEFQSWEKQKCFMQEELVVEKRKLASLILELEQAKALQEQFEARCNQEEKANEDLTTQISSTIKEREEVETSTKSEEDMIKQKAETSLRKYKDDIQKLEKEISKLRLETESPKIAALRRGIDGSHGRKVTQARRNLIAASLQAYSDSTAGVKRERECVMCLSEEMSVVFLPCAHQVVCTNCNELHEKQGMKDCPSCRSTIQRRIPVRHTR